MPASVSLETAAIPGGGLRAARGEESLFHFWRRFFPADRPPLWGKLAHTDGYRWSFDRQNVVKSTRYERSSQAI
jgi:hypothetical protein